MSTDPVTRHLTDEELLLDYYDESTAADRARLHAHLERCEECRILDRELRTVLSAVETTPLNEPPSDFERDMWARIEPQLPVRTSGPHPLKEYQSQQAFDDDFPAATTEQPVVVHEGHTTKRARYWTRPMPQLAAAATVVILVGAAFTAGRLWDRPAESPAQMADEGDPAERLLRAEVGDHLERSQRMLVELVNADVTTAALMTDDRARAADLVADGRLYQRSVETLGDDEVGSLLEDLERVLVELANGPPDAGPDDLARLRERIADQDLLFRVRVVTREMGW